MMFLIEFLLNFIGLLKLEIKNDTKINRTVSIQ